MKIFIALSAMALGSFTVFSNDQGQVKTLDRDYTQIHIDQAFAASNFCDVLIVVQNSSMNISVKDKLSLKLPNTSKQ